VLDVLLRLLADAGPAIRWITIFVAATVAVFVLYIGIAMYATLLARDSQEQRIRYRIFHDLLELFTRGRHR
jgi:hypothetical protein